MNRRRGTVPTWPSSCGQEAWYSTYLDKFLLTGGVVQYLPGQVPMNRRRGTVPTWTSSCGQEAWYSTYLDKVPCTEDVVQYLPGQVPVYRRRGTELHFIAEIVGPRLAEAASGLPSVRVELKK
jgi:hypothetical protein